MKRAFLTFCALAAAMPAPACPAPLQSGPQLGKAEGQCRPDEAGPALLVSAVGLKDRTGNLKLEIYPPDNADFLQDDNVLISQGKVFRRVEIAVPPAGQPQMCIRVPRPGNYAVVLLHDRDRNRKFGLSVDGIGFASNPHLGWSKPTAAHCLARAGAGLTPIDVILNYRQGLFSFSPMESTHAHR